MEDTIPQAYHYCYCGNRLWQGSSVSWSTTRGMQCRHCKRHEERLKRKPTIGTPNRVQHSKPLHPRGCGYTFRPDKMPMPAERFMFTDSSKSQVSGRYHWNERKKWNDKTFERAYRKRQRRVDRYFIDMALNDMRENDEV